MDTKSQISLGFDQMKAAVVGGHSIFDAWLELVEFAQIEKIPNVITGAIGCVLFCTRAIEQGGLLPNVESDRYNQFLHSGYEARLKTCLETLECSNWGELGVLVGVMAFAISQHRYRICFKDNAPLLSD